MQGDRLGALPAFAQRTGKLGVGIRADRRRPRRVHGNRQCRAFDRGSDGNDPAGRGDHGRRGIVAFSGALTDADANAFTDANAIAHAVTDTHAYAEPDSYPDAYAFTDANSDAVTHAYADPNADTHANIDVAGQLPCHEELPEVGLLRIVRGTSALQG